MNRLVRVLTLICAVTNVSATELDNIAIKMLTPEIAERILGAPVEAGSQNESADIHNGANVVSRAGYGVKAGGPSSPRIGLLLRRSATAEETKTAFLGSKAIYHGVDVAGLGDAAYRIDKPAQLNVLKGADWVIITAGVFPGADPALQEKTAREILPKL